MILWGETYQGAVWLNHVSHLVKDEEVVEQLLSPQGTMILAGQFGLGKTNELLHLMMCFAHGGRWHGLQVTPAVAFYLTWEGEPRKLGERIHIIEQQYAGLPLHFPWYIRLQEKKIPLDTPDGQRQMAGLVEDLKPRPQVLLIDPFKRTVSQDYIKPPVADAWTAGCNLLAQQLGCAIIVSAHTNKITYRTGDTPDALGADKVKGAGDLLDGVSTAILLAVEKGNKRITTEGGWSKVEWTELGTVMKVLKARDATAEFPLLRLNFNREKLRLYGEKWRVEGSVVEKVPEA